MEEILNAISKTNNSISILFAILLIFIITIDITLLIGLKKNGK